jgi:hypothetical protein
MNQSRKVFSLLGLIVITGFIFISSCKKEVKTYELHGIIYDPQFKKGVEGALVSLKASKVQSGVYNPNYTEIESVVSSSDGSYKFTVEYDNVSGYRLDVSKKDYFDQSYDIKTEELQQEGGYKANIDFLPIANVKLIVKNTSPQAADDKIQFWFSKLDDVKCKDCWNSDPIIGIGPSYSFNEEKMAIGEKRIEINWVVTKKGNQQTHVDYIDTKAFTTVNYNINY